MKTKIIKKKLRELLDESLTSSKVLSLYINNIKYNIYHGKISSKVLSDGTIINDIPLLYNESVEAYK